HTQSSLPLCSFTATPITATYTLSLHDALPIFKVLLEQRRQIDCLIVVFVHHLANSFLDYAVGLRRVGHRRIPARCVASELEIVRSEEHTSELQSRRDLVCRLLLEKKK